MPAQKSTYDLAYGQEPLPLAKLPEIFWPGDLGDISAVQEIRQRLAYYSMCIDGKAVEHLDKVFVRDVTSYYSEPLNHINGLENLQQTMKAATAPADLQHHQSTQLIKILSPRTAFSVTYYTSHHFPKNPPQLLSATEGKLSAFGQYQDHWIKTEDGWRICNRNMIYQGPLIGSVKVMGISEEDLANYDVSKQ